MKRFFYLVLILVASIMTITFAACGGGDDSTSAGGSGSGGGGSTPTANINIIGTWRAYYQRNGVQLYDLVSFNADHTGYVIEEVGNGTDNKNPITWTMTGNVITVKLDGDYVITWTILQVIDDNTVIISDGKRNYNVVRDGTGGGTSSSNFVSKGGGSLTVAQLLGTWQVYHVEYYAVVNGQVYSQSYEIYANDQSKGMTTCYRYEFYADYTYKRTEYYNGDWIAPRNNSYRETGGRIYLPELGTPAPEYCMVTANKTRSDEIVITTHFTRDDEYTEYLLKRVEGGETPATNPVLGTFNFVYQSYYDETPYDYYGGFVTIVKDSLTTEPENAVTIMDLFLEGSSVLGYYDLDKGVLYVGAWAILGVEDEYGLITVNWKDTKADWIPFTINNDGSLTSDCFGVYAYDADFTSQVGWWEAATIATLTPTNSASSRRTSAKRSVTTKIMKIDKGHLSNKRIKK